MAEIIKNMWSARLNVLYAVMFSWNSLVISFTTACIGITASNQLTRWQWVMLCLGVSATWSNTMLAFIKQTERRISAGQPFIPQDDDTQFLKKSSEILPKV